MEPQWWYIDFGIENVIRRLFQHSEFQAERANWRPKDWGHFEAGSTDRASDPSGSVRSSTLAGSDAEGSPNASDFASEGRDSEAADEPGSGGTAGSSEGGVSDSDACGSGGDYYKGVHREGATGLACRGIATCSMGRGMVFQKHGICMA